MNEELKQKLVDTVLPPHMVEVWIEAGRVAIVLAAAHVDGKCAVAAYETFVEAEANARGAEATGCVAIVRDITEMLESKGDA